jgi:hypothetical protein
VAPAPVVLIHITRHPKGPRLHVCGLRIHHGSFGVALSLLGLALVWHDLHDWPWPIHDPKDTA